MALFAKRGARRLVIAVLALALPVTPSIVRAADAPGAPAEVLRGKAYYTTCAGCHGNAGEGFWGMRAPRLAGMPQAYVERQLRLFRSGLRGGPADFYGVAMNGRAKALPDDQAVRDVAAYIATLPKGGPAPARSSDHARGKALYESCAACHGDRAQGDPAQSAPPLRGLEPWYLAAQLRNFKTGVRGREGDGPGLQMRAAASAIPDEAAINDLSKYLASLP